MERLPVQQTAVVWVRLKPVLVAAGELRAIVPVIIHAVVQRAVDPV